MMTDTRLVPLDRVDTICATCGDLVTRIEWVVMTLDGSDERRMVGESCSCRDTITGMKVSG